MPRMTASISVTYFFITDGRATDRTLGPTQVPVTLGTSSTSSSGARFELR